MHNCALYEYLGLAIVSDIPLGARVKGANPSLTIHCAVPDDIKNWPLTTAQPRSSQEGWVTIAKYGDIFAIDFVHRVKFFYNAPRRRIVYLPRGGISKKGLAHLLENHLIPMVLNHLGAFVLHASAVEIDGSVVSFIAASGRGKSTLAAACAAQGYGLVADDSIRLDVIDDAVTVTAGVPALRLWQDSPLLPDAHSAEDAYPPGKKTIKVVAGRRKGLLNKLFVLGSSLGKPTAVTSRRLGVADAAIRIFEAGFRLDAKDKNRIGKDWASSFQVAERVPVYSLEYPRSYQHLGEVVRHVAHLVATTPRKTTVCQAAPSASTESLR